MGTHPEVTTATEKVVIKNTDENPEQMVWISVPAAQASAYNVGKLKGAIDQYKENMAQMKETLRKEHGESREVKQKHDATLSYLERLQEAYQVLEAKKEALVLPNTIVDGEKKDL